MKTAISIPDALFSDVESYSHRLKMSRSKLFAVAVSEYLARHAAPSEATERWNQALDEGGQPGDDAAAMALRRRSKATLRAALGPTE